MPIKYKMGLLREKELKLITWFKILLIYCSEYIRRKIRKLQLFNIGTKTSKTNHQSASIYHAVSERNNSTTIAGLVFVENTELAI